MQDWRQKPSQPVQSLIWQVQSFFFFFPHSIDASYSNKELNHESDSQDQQPLHMSITKRMAVCMTAVQTPLSNCQPVTKQATVTRKRYGWQLGSCRWHSVPIIHIWNWPVVQNGRIYFIQYFFCFTVFSHYLPLMLHRGFTHLSVLTSELAFNHNSQRASGMSQVLPPPLTSMKTLCPRTVDETKKEMIENWESMLGSQLITLSFSMCMNLKGKKSFEWMALIWAAFWSNWSCVLIIRF